MTNTPATASIRPLGDRVLVEPIKEPEVKGGIFIPDAAKAAPTQAIVIAIGAGRLVDGILIPLEVEAGQRVLVSTYGGTDVKSGDKTYRLLNGEDVLAVLS